MVQFLFALFFVYKLPFCSNLLALFLLVKQCVTGYNFQVMAILSRVRGFWSSFSFVKNVKKMRSALMDYLRGEGVKCEVKDGAVLFNYEGEEFAASFVDGEECAGCLVTRSIEKEEYSSLPSTEKAFIVDAVNGRYEHYIKVCAYKNSVDVLSGFYFTSERMMLRLFVKHLEQMQECIDDVERLIGRRAAECCKPSNAQRRIGFYIPEETSEGEEAKISAKKG